jgi:hypothetical protein
MPTDKPRLALWRVVLAGVWITVVLGAGIVTRLDPDLHICKTTTIVTDPATSVETSTDATGTVTGEKTTSAPPTEQSTRACEPLGVAEMAVLLLPFLILVAPILKGFNIAGLFGFDFREFQEKVVDDAKAQVIRVVVAHDIGVKTKEAVNQMEEGRVSDLPEA